MGTSPRFSVVPGSDTFQHAALSSLQYFLGPRGEGLAKRGDGREATEVLMPARIRPGNKGGQAVEQFERGNDQRHVTLGTGLGGVVAIASRVDLTQAILGEGGPGAIAQQALEGLAFVSTVEYADIQTESTTVCPGQHVAGVLGFEKSARGGVGQQRGSDGLLQAWNEVMIDGIGGHEAHTALKWIQQSWDALEESGTVWVLSRSGYRRLSVAPSAYRLCGQYRRAISVPGGAMRA